MYFKLNEYCKFIKGEDGDIIYNFNTGDMITLKTEFSKIIDLCENSLFSIEKLSNSEINFLKILEANQIGKFFSQNIYIDNMYLGFDKEVFEIINENNMINTAYIELGSKCNLNCVFCNDNEFTFRRTGCKKWKENKTSLTLEQWKKTIDELIFLKCNNIIFIGGEPLLYFDTLKILVEYCSKNNINNFTIYTNGYLLDKNMINFFIKYKVNLIIQVLGSNNEIYKNITNKDNLEETIFNNIKKLSYNKLINLNILILINKYNENDIEKIKYKYKNLVNKIIIEYIYPKPENNYYSKLFLNDIYNKEKRLSKVTLSDFCINDKYNNCFKNMISINYCGDVLCCPMLRSFKLGNIKEHGLGYILKNSEYTYLKKLSKNKINKCKNCSLRYGCFDCRAIELSATKSITGIEYCNKVKK